MTQTPAAAPLPLEYDVVVVGLGPGGEAVATGLAKAGLSVLGVDRRLVGGECPYFGCIPSKMMIRAAGALAEARRVDGLAGHADVRPDWTPVADRIRDEATDDWDDAVAVKRLEDAGATFWRGAGRLDGARRVVVTADDGTERVAVARRGVVLNTGTEPAVPPVDGLADTPFWTNRDIVAVRERPASLAVLGGGAIGSELAQAFARFGVAVTLVEAGPRILGPEEPEASAVVARALEADGVTVRAGVGVQGVRHDGGFHLALADGSEVVAEQLLVAAGRRPNLRGIGLATVGVDESARSLDVDDHLRVAGTDGLWAVGDITGKGAFTHMSMYQAALVVRDLVGDAGDAAPWAQYHAVSRATFTDPEVGSVGMTEQQARDAGLRVGVGVTKLEASSRGWLHRAGNEGLIKVVADLDAGVLVGATAVGPSGGEIVGMLVTAVHARVPIATLRGMHFAYPTFHRAIETALADLG